MTKIRMLEKYNGAGLALLEARAMFMVASQYGDDIQIETSVTEFRRSSFFVLHRVTKGGVLALEGSRDARVDRPRSTRQSCASNRHPFRPRCWKGSSGRKPHRPRRSGRPLHRER